MTTKTSGIFRGGVPTEPDVKTLMQHIDIWGWAQGAIIPYSHVENVINVTKDSYRFKSVTASWKRRMLRERNMDVIAVAGVGYRWLPEAERVTESVRDNVKHTKGIGRAVRRISLVRGEMLSDKERGQKDHAQQLMEHNFDAVRRSMKKIAVVFNPAKALPRGR